MMQFLKAIKETTSAKEAGFYNIKIESSKIHQVYETADCGDENYTGLVVFLVGISYRQKGYGTLRLKALYKVNVNARGDVIAYFESSL